MNTGRMTFRFDEAERRTERNEKISKLEQAAETLDEDEYSDKLNSEINPRLTAVPEPLEGWGDPFSKNDAWEEMMTHRQQRVDLREQEEMTGPDINNSFPEYRKNRPTSLWRIFGTVTAAVVTGALFGFVVLSFIDLGSIFPKDSSKITDSEAISVTSLVPTVSDGQIPMVAVTFEPQTYYMLQYGVFSNAERVEVAKRELEQFGLAAGDDPNQENRVYAGISTDREQAKLLSNQLKTQGVELYVREITMPSVSELTFAGDAQSLNNYFAISKELITSLSNHSTFLLGLERPTSLNDNETVDLTELHRVWTESIKGLQVGLTTEEIVGVKKMELAMNSALSSIAEYNKNTSKGHLWEIQSSMMQYIMGQKQLLEMMKES